MLFLVASILQGQPGVSHAMVLDKFDEDNDVLIFKNTYNDQENGHPKQFEIRRTDRKAPEELYFVHIDVKDMESLPTQKEREAKKKAEIEEKKREIENRRTN